MGAIEDFRDALAVRADSEKISAADALQARIRAEVLEVIRAGESVAPAPTSWETYTAPFRARDVAAIEARMAAPDPVRMVAKPRDELRRLATAQAERERERRAESARKEAELQERERAAWAREDAAREAWRTSPERVALDRAESGVDILLRSMAHRWLEDGTTYCGAATQWVSPLPQYLPRLRASRNAWSCPDCRMVAGLR